MHELERVAFAEAMRDVAAYYDRKLPNPVLAMYWSGLSDLPLDAVKRALNRHVQDPQAGQFMPKIADIRRQVEAGRPDDGHVGPDEAWALAIQARSEDASVVWTDLIAAAFFAAALPLLDVGDKIAARRAFLERYGKDLAAARARGDAPRWHLSGGTDSHLRELAVEDAVRQGRITEAYADKLLPPALPAPSAHAVQLLEHGLATEATSPEVARQHVATLRTLLGMR